MAKLIITITKHPDAEWVAPRKGHPDQNFNDKEKAILEEYYKYIENLPGLIKDVYTNETVGDVNTAVLHFDTLEHANEANQKLFLSPSDVAVLDKIFMMRKKFAGHPHKHVRTTEVVQ